jgi:hypothetical protein
MSTLYWDLLHADLGGHYSISQISDCIAQVAAAMDEVTTLLSNQQEPPPQQPQLQQRMYSHFLAGELLRWCMAGGSAVLSVPEPVSGSSMRQRAVNLAAALTYAYDVPLGPADPGNLEIVLKVMDR